MIEHSDYINALTNGFQAGLDGLDPRLCPYDKLSDEWNIWQRWHGLGTKRAAVNEQSAGGNGGKEAQS